MNEKRQNTSIPTIRQTRCSSKTARKNPPMSASQQQHSTPVQAKTRNTRQDTHNYKPTQATNQARQLSQQQQNPPPPNTHQPHTPHQQTIKKTHSSTNLERRVHGRFPVLGVHPQDFTPGPARGQGESQLPIKTPGASEGRVQTVRPVGGADNDHLGKRRGRTGRKGGTGSKGAGEGGGAGGGRVSLPQS